MMLSEAFAEAAELLRTTAAAEDFGEEDAKKKGRKRRKKGQLVVYVSLPFHLLRVNCLLNATTRFPSPRL